MSGRCFRLTFAAALLMGLAGCGQGSVLVDGPESASQPRQFLDERERVAGLAAQEEVLARGGPTARDYERAVRRLDGCLDRLDVVLTDHGWNPVDQQQMILTFNGPGLADDELTAITDQCYAAHLERVEQRYVTTAPPRMRPDLARFARDCLGARGIRAAGDEASVPELVATTAAESDVHECVGDGLRQLYPDLPLVMY